MIALAALALLSLYVLPIWKVHLTAPQYPEGLGMHIRISTIEGMREHDLNNINRLNHYIGMRPIEPDAFPELKYMPWIVAVLIAGGLAAAAWGRRKGAYAWVGAITGAGIAGLADYWRWGRDYGHNLDPATAIIEIPGMTYQPPLIGTKELANFTASSWPAAGGWIAAAAVLLVIAVLVVERRARRRPPAPASRADEMGTLAAAAAGLLLLAAPLPLDAQSQLSLRVGENAEFRTLTAALQAAREGDRIVVSPGRYLEPTIVVEKRVSIVGEPGAVLAGQGPNTILVIAADSVTVSGLRFVNVEHAFTSDPAAIRVSGASGCLIENNVVDSAFFGIYLARGNDCTVRGNIVRGAPVGEAETGNGIHLWNSTDVLVADNVVTGHRDGIYLEFARHTTLVGNRSERNLRYGLHYMYSDESRYVGNTFRANGSGVAVMYTKNVEMTRNLFDSNTGGAAYGLLLKEIADATLDGNVFRGNTTALLGDGVTRLKATGNTFTRNGWAVRLLSNAQEARFTGNNFAANTFDVTTNGRHARAEFSGNYWAEYRGTDVNGDGIGDTPFRPVRLFSLVVELYQPAIILMRSFFAQALDAAERVIPTLIPDAIVDRTPAIRWIRT